MLFVLVTDTMQRESAIADDFWRHMFKYPKKNRIDVMLENIERKYEETKSNGYVYVFSF